MTTVATAIQSAIDDSIRENRIVTLTATIDSAEWVALADELMTLSTDYAEQGTDLGEIREYWGTDDDGDNWRIHLIGR